MFVDNYIPVEGAVYNGDAEEMLHGIHFDPGYLRPYAGRGGEKLVTIKTGKMVYNNEKKLYLPEKKAVRVRDLMARGIYHPVFNATTLRKEEWIMFDRAVVKAARQRLALYDDMKRTVPFGGFNGMSKITLEYEAMNDPGEALVDMDGLAEGRTDNPLFKLRSLPLPITHSDFWFSTRRIALSRNTGTPLDTTMVEAAGRRVAEMIERTALGTVTGITFGTQSTGVTAHDGSSAVYGLTNFPYRVTKTDLTTPDGTNPEAVMQDVIEMREQLYAIGFYGPFVLYHSDGYDAFLDNDYFRTGSTSVSQTLRDRIMAIRGISDVRRLDFLTTDYQMILVQMTPDVLRAVTGMELTVVQWESQGGMRQNFKVMTIEVPQFRADYNGNTGIVHGTTP